MAADRPTAAGSQPPEDQRAGLLEACFVFASLWSLGAHLTAKGREVTDAFFRALSAGEDPSGEGGSRGPASALLLGLPRCDTVWDLVFSLPEGRWGRWDALLERPKLHADAPLHSVLVPTVETLQRERVVASLLRRAHHVLVTGPTGTGKTVLLRRITSEVLPADRFASYGVGFSARTSANQAQDVVDSKLTRRRAGEFGPPVGKRAVLVLDDLNMPAPVGEHAAAALSSHTKLFLTCPPPCVLRNASGLSPPWSCCAS